MNILSLLINKRNVTFLMYSWCFDSFELQHTANSNRKGYHGAHEQNTWCCDDWEMEANVRRFYDLFMISVVVEYELTYIQSLW